MAKARRYAARASMAAMPRAASIPPVPRDIKNGLPAPTQIRWFSFPGINLARMRDAMGVFIMGDAYFGPFRISGYVSS